MSDDALKEPRADCWPFDPSPPKLAKSDNGFVWCPACESPQPVAGHECRAVAEALGDWGPGEEENSLREQAEAAARLQALTEMLDAQWAQFDAIAEALDEWALVGDESLAESVIRLRHAYEALVDAPRGR